MNRIIFVLCLLLFTSKIFAQEQVFFKNLPTPTGVESSADPSIPNIAWNRWTTQNFTILSIDPVQGEYLTANIEEMKTWVLTRWGLPDIGFSSECRIFAAPNKKTMKKLFNMDGSYCEVRKNVNYLWLVLDRKPSETIPAALSVVAIKEIEKSSNFKFGWWVHRGISNLNLTVNQITNNVTTLEKSFVQDKPIFFTKSILNITEKDWTNFDDGKRNLFDYEASVLCLLIRKEFGQDLFHDFIRTNYSEPELNTFLNHRSYDEFDSTFKKYTNNLITDVLAGRTPEEYFLVWGKNDR